MTKADTVMLIMFDRPDPPFAVGEAVLPAVDEAVEAAVDEAAVADAVVLVPLIVSLVMGTFVYLANCFAMNASA
jgi:hypothetical protein